MTENNRLIHTDTCIHFEFKLKFRTLDHQLSDRVSKPIFGLPLDNGSTLVIQLPHQFHLQNPLHVFLHVESRDPLVVLSLFSICYG
ncbi:histidine kinase sensor domain-containing protein [Vibrio chagasii]|nr:histidine kinase sensor domain-containing protein [Vibrio chagasii]